MSLKRLNKMDDLLCEGIKKGSQVIYDQDTIDQVFDILDEEKSKQDRKIYMAAYYAENKELMDARAKVYYENNKEQIKEKRKALNEQNS